MRPYKEPVSAERREKLIVGAAAGVTGIYRYFEAQRLVEKHLLATPPPFTALRRRLGATIRVHADQARNSSSAAAGPHCIKALRSALASHSNLQCSPELGLCRAIRNAGTSAGRNLPLSREMAINLQSFGGNDVS